MPRLSVRMEPRAFQGGVRLPSGHGCSHVAPFSRHWLAAVLEQGCMPGQGRVRGSRREIRTRTPNALNTHVATKVEAGATSWTPGAGTRVTVEVSGSPKARSIAATVVSCGVVGIQGTALW